MARRVNNHAAVPFAGVVAAEFRERGYIGDALEAVRSCYAAEVSVGPLPRTEADARGLVSLAVCRWLAEGKAERDGHP